MNRDRRVVASAAAIIAMSVGTLVLVGWAFDADVLKSLHPAFASMKPNTAIALLISGVALWVRRHDSTPIGVVGRVSAVIVLLIAVATLVEYAGGLDLHIDQLVFTDDASHRAPGRMALATAVCLSLVGTALITIDAESKRWGRPAQWLALLAGALAVSVVTGYLYGVEALYRTSTFTSVSVYTAITILVLCLGILYARPSVGMMRVMTLQGSPTSAVVRRLVPVMILLPILFGWLRLLGQQAGLYGFEFGLALFALSNVIVMSGLLWWTCASQLRLELAAREREQSLATTLDSIGDAVIVTDPGGVVVRMNPVAERLTGWTVAEAIGRQLREVFAIINEETRRVVDTPVERVLRDGRIVGLANHTVLRSRTGTEVPIADSAAPIIEKDSTIRGVVLVFRDMTSERDAQRVIVASEQRYRDLYESSPDMHLTADLTTDEITDCNQTLCDRLGYERSELLGQPFRTVYLHDYDGDEDDRRAAFRVTAEFVDVERRLRCKDGTSIEVSLNLRGIRDSTGKLVTATAVWRDITKRKQADRDRQFLIQLGDEFRSSTEPGRVLLAVSGRLGEYLRASRCSFAEIDSAADCITAHPGYQTGVASVAGTLSLSAFGAETAAACARGETIVVENTATDPRTAALFDVSYRRVSVYAYVLTPMLRDGRWIACLSVSSDRPRAWEDREITLVTLVAERVWLWIEHLRVLAELRKRDVDEAIRHSDERFRALVDGVKDYAIFMLDPEGNVATWNEGAQRLKGYRSEEITGKHLSVFSTLEDLASDHTRLVLERARQDGRFEEEGWRVRKDGSRFWASILLTALYDRDGSIEGFAKITRDFTDRRNQDETLRAKQAALVQSLKEREVLLQEVHHRVKNNLQVISSLINMQVRKLELGSTRDALVECQTRVQTIALIHEKLYQSKDYSQVRFADYARSLAANVFHATGTSPGNVTLDLAIDEVPLGVDRAIPCGLVINELITNALKHGLKNGRPGTIRVELRKAEEGKLRLSVEDDGVGLPAGFDIHHVESMGLQLVCTLSEQLDATIVVNGASGASFALTFAG